MLPVARDKSVTRGLTPVSLKQQGFSLFELIVVFVVIGILAAKGFDYYGDLIKQAKAAGLESVARQFAAVSSGLHAQWVVSQTQNAPLSPQYLEQQPVYMNEYGWPANTNAKLSAVSKSQSAIECEQLWQAFSRFRVAASVEGRAVRGTEKYHVSVPAEAVCRYELALDKKLNTHFFEYNLVTGNIHVHTPE